MEWNNTTTEYPRNRCIHQLFEEQVERTPRAIAAVFRDKKITYRELNTRANRLAHCLQSLGVGPETLVALCLERSLEMLVGLWGVLKAGGAYVPLDPTYPAERLDFMLQDTQATVLLTQKKIYDLRFTNYDSLQPQVVCLDSDWDRIAPANEQNPTSGVMAQNLAYVIYTSGSTGKPKGVMITHQGLVNYLSWCVQAYDVAAHQGAPVNTSISFDATITSLFSPLLVGRTVALLPEGEEIVALADLLRSRPDFSLVKITPAHLAALSQLLPDEDATGQTNAFIIGGEALLEEHLSFWRTHAPNTRLINEYGPTESVVGCCVYEAPPEAHLSGAVPIGRPIANTRLYILDEELQPVPVGVAGELYIGGDGLARGYLNRPDLTAEKFIPNPFLKDEGGRRKDEKSFHPFSFPQGKPSSLILHPSSFIPHPSSFILYKSGDLARYLPDGNIEFLGRLDHQVKIRGFRIELGEIETVLRQHPAVDETVIVALATTVASATTGQPGEKRLAAYLVSSQSPAPTPRELRNFLLDKLPDYMVPTTFVVLDSFPLTPNGKIDRRALPAPARTRPQEEIYVAPRTDLERLFVDMWQDALGLESIGIHDDFFELGGDSIKAAIMANKIQAQLGEVVHVVALFDAPTVAQLAGYFNEHYPEAIAKMLGLEPGQTTAASDEQVNEMKVAQLRRLIPPLAPLDRPETETSKNPPVIFILSPPRSGSTLLRVMLGGHPQLFAPPELELLSFNTLAERKTALSGRYSFLLEGAVRAMMQIKGCDVEQAQRLIQEAEDQHLSTQQFYGLLQQWLKDKTLVEKSTTYALDLEILKRAELDFENALYIHLVRHPYGMLRSFEKARMDQIFFRYEHPFSRRELAELIWLVCHQNTLEFLNHVPGHRQYQVRFEDLVKQPREAVEGICQFLNLDFHPDMLQPYQEKEQRMTDGLYPASRMIGDPLFHHHRDIEAAVADRWQAEYTVDFLADVTWQMAESFGYKRSQSKKSGVQLNAIRRVSRSNAAQLLAQLDQLSEEEVNALLDDVLAENEEMSE